MTAREKAQLKIALGVLSGRLDPLGYVDDDVIPGVIRVDAALTGLDEDDLFRDELHWEAQYESRVNEHRAQTREYAEGVVFRLLVKLAESQEVEF